MKRYLVLVALFLHALPSVGQEQFLDIPKAVVQFNGVPKTGTYVQNGTTITVTLSTGYIEDPRVPGYNYRVGDGVDLDFTSGSGADTYQEIVSVSPPASASSGPASFTVTSNVSAVTSGNVTVRVWVPVHFNIRSVRQVSKIGGGFYTGRYHIVFETPFIDDRYAAVGGGRYMVVEHVTGGAFTPAFYTYGGNEKSMEYVSFAFYGSQ
jgi:hypothetical protein